MSAEQKARDMLERLGIENAKDFSVGEKLAEIANLIALADELVAWKAQLEDEK